tara:strand:- start:74 stop:565 length:492 start_codon:yes stop_codon:yes gene_type:complete
MKITKQRLKEIIKEELEGISVEDELGVTEPRFEAGSPEGKLINKLLIHAKVEGAKGPEDAAALLGLGDDEEVIEYIGSLMNNPMYKKSEPPRERDERSYQMDLDDRLMQSGAWQGEEGVEEGKVSGHRSEVTYSKSKRGKSKKPEKKAYNKAERAQAKRDLKK